MKRGLQELIGMKDRNREDGRETSPGQIPKPANHDSWAYLNPGLSRTSTFGVSEGLQGSSSSSPAKPPWGLGIRV